MAYDRISAQQERIAKLRQENQKLLDRYAAQDKYIEPIANAMEKMVLGAFSRGLRVMQKISGN